eukprot:TRINITY_DN73818_c0_g1_i1.p1 TRINITY_DN73818_c0_g1~~TRINITY_DN73818_c0_g1_i1.p1  ORF type:complete len:407 (-),score=57.92 TRINITY_DN73818_c0_g1_i1:60-1280(-)
MESTRYSAPCMTDEERERYTVPFSSVTSHLRAMLDEHGIAIVTGVVSSEEELQAFEADFAQDLQDLVDMDALATAPAAVNDAYLAFVAEGPRAFPAKTMSHLTAAAGFAIYRCLAHGRFAWRVRRHPNVHEVFRAIYGTEDLVTSLDVTMFSPDEPPSRENPFSAHVDQNPEDTRPDLGEREIYQGVFYAWPSGSDGHASTTTVWPGSHQSVFPEMSRDALFRANGASGFHYCEIQEMRKREAARKLAAGWRMNARRAVVPSGSVFLWNSKTVHTGWRGGPRLAQAVCLEPANRRSPQERLAKMRLAALGLPSTHWASVGQQHDMVLLNGGYFGRGGTPARVHMDGQVSLPLRRALRPAALAHNAELERLESLVVVDYKYTGMWEPTQGSEELLESSVSEDFKRFL